jgi:putative salt-induced outer membrane protein YdiY
VASLLAPQADEEPRDRWTGSFSAGAIWTAGNTDRISASVTASAKYRREEDRWSADFLWNYAEENDALTDRRLFAALQYDYFLGPRDYLLGQASAEYSATASLDLRSTLGVGYGHQFLDDETWQLAGEVGLTWVTEEYAGASPEDGEFFAARLAYDALWKASERWSLGSKGRLLPSLEDKDDVSSRTDTFAQFALTASIFTKLQWIWEWDNTPAAGRERNDHQVLLTVGWTF